MKQSHALHVQTTATMLPCNPSTHFLSSPTRQSSSFPSVRFTHDSRAGGLICWFSPCICLCALQRSGSMSQDRSYLQPVALADYMDDGMPSADEAGRKKKHANLTSPSILPAIVKTELTREIQLLNWLALSTLTTVIFDSLQIRGNERKDYDLSNC